MNEQKKKKYVVHLDNGADYLGDSDIKQWSTNPFMHIIHTSIHPAYVKLLPKISNIHTL